MRRKGYNGAPDDVRGAWRGAQAGLAGSNGLIIGALLFLAIARILK